MAFASSLQGQCGKVVSCRGRNCAFPRGQRGLKSSSRQVVVQCKAELSLSRRAAMLASTGVAIFAMPTKSQADEEFTTFFGLASPPTSYGGYGGNANESPKYSFEYPTGWRSEQPNKVEKGTQGIDSRVVNPKSKDQKVFVITLTRAGEDDKSFRLTDLDSTFQGFAGADYQLLDALSSATNITKDKREVDNTLFYTYDIESPDYRYLSSIAVKDGKVFAMFVKSPTKMFKSSDAKLRHIVDTFRLL